MRAQQLSARRFVEAHPEDAARLIEQRAGSESASFLEELRPETAADVIARMSPVAGADCIAPMKPQGSADIIAALPPLIAAALLRRVATELRESILSLLPDETKTALRRLLTYPQETVGSITDPDVLALPEDISVAEGLRQLRRHRGTAHHHVYVTDRAQQLVGVLHIRDVVSRSKATLADIMRPAHDRLTATSRLAGAAAHPAWRQLDTLPVTDESGVLIGMVRFRQLRQLDAMSGPGAVTDTLLGLGELYWAGLTTFFPMLSEGTDDSANAFESSKGGHRGE